MSENENKITKNGGASNLMQLMSFTADKALEMADANSIIGEKIEIDGMTIIPISKVSSGFAGGGANMINATQKKSNVPSGSGAKVTVTPLSVIVVCNGELQVLNISAPAKAPKNNLIGSVIEQVQAMIKSKKANKEKEEELKESAEK